MSDTTEPTREQGAAPPLMPMPTFRRAILMAAGAEESTVDEFLGLSEAERAVVEYRAGLAREAQRLRTSQGLTQREAAKLIGVTQSRIPLIEGGQASIEATAKAIVALGGNLPGPPPGEEATPPPAPAAAAIGRRTVRRTPRSTGAFVRPPLMVGRKGSKRPRPVGV